MAARATLLVSGSAALSRVLGFARDVLIAAALGAGPVADAFLIALRLPNLVRRVLSEGALTAGFAPIYLRISAERGEGEAARFAGAALGAFALGLIALVALAHFGAGAIVVAIAAGLAGDEATRALAETLARLAFPSVAFLGLAAMASAALAARGRVVALALAPLALNLVLVAALLALPGRVGDDATLALALAAATSLAALLQLAIVAVPALRGGAVAPARPRLDPQLRRLAALALPAALTVAAPQLVLLAATPIASFTPGAVAWLHYADRLVGLPLSLVGVAVATVLLPAVAARAQAGDADGLSAAQNRALEAALLVALPAAAALVVLDETLARVLFERGAFGPADTAGTAAMIAGLALGLPVAIVGKVLTQEAYARETMRAALLATGLGVAAAVPAAAAFGAALGPFGIALGASLGLAVHAGVVAAAALRGGGWRPDARLGRRLLGALAASAAMSLALAAAQAPALALGPLAGLALLCGGGLCVYFAAALAFGAVRPAELGRVGVERGPSPR